MNFHHTWNLTQRAGYDIVKVPSLREKYISICAYNPLPHSHGPTPLPHPPLIPNYTNDTRGKVFQIFPCFCSLLSTNDSTRYMKIVLEASYLKCARLGNFYILPLRHFSLHDIWHLPIDHKPKRKSNMMYHVNRVRWEQGIRNGQYRHNIVQNVKEVEIQRSILPFHLENNAKKSLA